LRLNTATCRFRVICAGPSRSYGLSRSRVKRKGSIGVWTLNTFSITATATTEKLEFISQVTDGLPSYGNEITNVSLSAPEPSSWVMMMLGFAGLGYAGYRKAKGSQVFLAA
jgi:hypothetical protein